MTQDRAIRPRRSFMFSPGLRPEIFPKALASGTDIVCVELEDGFREADTGLVVIDGKLIEKPVLRDMHRILAIAERVSG